VISAIEPAVLIVTSFEHINSGRVRQLCWLRAAEELERWTFMHCAVFTSSLLAKGG
jgi:hypothetical protein